MFADADLLEPRDEMEAAVDGVFQDVFDIRWVGVHDDFVALGGHPALAMRVSAELAKRQNVWGPAALVLDHSSPASLTEWITGRSVPGSTSSVEHATGAVFSGPARLP